MSAAAAQAIRAGPPLPFRLIRMASPLYFGCDAAARTHLLNRRRFCNAFSAHRHIYHRVEETDRITSPEFEEAPSNLSCKDLPSCEARCANYAWCPAADDGIVCCGAPCVRELHGPLVEHRFQCDGHCLEQFAEVTPTSSSDTSADTGANDPTPAAPTRPCLPAGPLPMRRWLDGSWRGGGRGTALLACGGPLDTHGPSRK